MKLKKITTSVALAACLLGTMAVSANADSVHYGLDTGYTVGSVGSTTLNGPLVGLSIFTNFSKNWRAAMNFGVAFLNGNDDANSELGSGNLYLGEYNIQLGYQVLPKLYTYGLVGVAGLNTSTGFGSNNDNNDGLIGFEWGAGVSYDWMKYMSVYAQYTGQSLSASGVSNMTGTFFTAGLQFHTALF